MKCVWRPCETCRQLTGLSVACRPAGRSSSHCLQHLPKAFLSHTKRRPVVQNINRRRTKSLRFGFLASRSSLKGPGGFTLGNSHIFRVGIFWLHTENKEESALHSAKVVSLKHSWHATNVAGFCFEHVFAIFFWNKKQQKPEGRRSEGLR